MFRLGRALRDSLDSLVLLLAWPANRLLCALMRDAARPRSVLHVSYMVHIPWMTVEILKAEGMDAAYMAMGESPVWDKCDYKVAYSKWPGVRALQQLRWFWSVMARYEIVHLHFMHTLSPSGWELPLLRRMGRSVVANFRGCEARDRDANIRLHPTVNICQECDYWSERERAYMCGLEINVRRRELAKRYADLILVTTPDMQDFMPEAVHFPFFAPLDSQLPEPAAHSHDGPIRIVHATNHPGIEGTAAIRSAIDGLAAKGHRIEFVFLKGVAHEDVLRELSSADLAIGKMKMGYYANAQIESMMMGVPTVTWVRPEFVTPELERSGFILCDLETLEPTLEYYLGQPEKLAEKRVIARRSIRELHDNERLAASLMAMYDDTRAGRSRHEPTKE